MLIADCNQQSALDHQQSFLDCGGAMKFLKLVGAAVAVLALCTPAWAQVDSGRIAGIVRDSSGALAVGVTAKVKNERTGEERTAVTNDKGYFIFTGLKPSTYTIRV